MFALQKSVGKRSHLALHVVVHLVEVASFVADHAQEISQAGVSVVSETAQLVHKRRRQLRTPAVSESNSPVRLKSCQKALIYLLANRSSVLVAQMVYIGQSTANILQACLSRSSSNGVQLKRAAQSEWLQQYGAHLSVLELYEIGDLDKERQLPLCIPPCRMRHDCHHGRPPVGLQLQHGCNHVDRLRLLAEQMQAVPTLHECMQTLCMNKAHHAA